MLLRNGIETLEIFRARQVDVNEMKTRFNLAKNAHHTRLIDYHGFLTVALEGRGLACDKVREYLLAMEKKARLDTVVNEGIGISSTELEQNGSLDATIQRQRPS